MGGSQCLNSHTTSLLRPATSISQSCHTFKCTVLGWSLQQLCNLIPPAMHTPCIATSPDGLIMPFPQRSFRREWSLMQPLTLGVITQSSAKTPVSCFPEDGCGVWGAALNVSFVRLECMDLFSASRIKGKNLTV